MPKYIKNLQINNMIDKDTIKLRGVICQDNFFDGEIDCITPKDVDKALENANSNNLEIILNSGGGDVYASIEIYNTLKSLNKNITTIISGRAFSGAHLIAMAGDERLMYDNSQGLAHNSSTVTWGNKEELLETLDFLDKIDDNLMNIYMNNFNGSKEELRELMKEGKPMNAKECLEKGFATRILTNENDEGFSAKDNTKPTNEVDGVNIDEIVNRVKEILTNEIKVDDKKTEKEAEEKSLFKHFKGGK